jgi:DNA repair protein RecO (recombination protein O)
MANVPLGPTKPDKPNTLSCHALVVGGRDYGEADRIIQLLTNTGQMSVFAHGARKSRRRFQGAFEPFTTIEMELEPRRRAGLRTVRSASVRRSRLDLRSQLEKIALASYVTELATVVAPEGDPASDLYDLAEQTLEMLLEMPASIMFRRLFELKLIDILGYAPRLNVCVHCEVQLLEISYLDLVRGGLFCAEHAEDGVKVGPKTVAWMGALYGVDISQATRLAAHGPAQDSVIDQSWMDTAAAKLGPSVSSFFAHLLGHPLKSSPLLQTVRL